MIREKLDLEIGECELNERTREDSKRLDQASKNLIRTRQYLFVLGLMFLKPEVEELLKRKIKVDSLESMRSLII